MNLAHLILETKPAASAETAGCVVEQASSLPVRVIFPSPGSQENHVEETFRLVLRQQFSQLCLLIGINYSLLAFD
jgi:hypothetical protein